MLCNYKTNIIFLTVYTRNHSCMDSNKSFLGLIPLRIIVALLKLRIGLTSIGLVRSDNRGRIFITMDKKLGDVPVPVTETVAICTALKGSSSSKYID